MTMFCYIILYKDGSIALDNMVLEIKNMNGYNLKTKVKH